MAHNHDIIVIGGSAGSVSALLSIMEKLPHNLQASIFIVSHIPSNQESILDQLLSYKTGLKVRKARDKDPIELGTVYVAREDHHLILEQDKVRVIAGPKENNARPAIDTLFRSAAQVFRTRVIGVVLSGFLDDGSAGLWAIKACGGIAVVQDPDDAEYPFMPRHVIAKAQVDYIVPQAGIAPLLVRLAQTSAPGQEGYLVPEFTRIENSIMRREINLMDALKTIGKPSSLVCPECHGALYEVKDGPLHYRCHVGHSYAPLTLENEMDHDLEATLWQAVRGFEEKAHLYEQLIEKFGEGHMENIRSEYRKKIEEAEINADRLKTVLMKFQHENSRNHGITEQSPGE